MVNENLSQLSQTPALMPGCIEEFSGGGNPRRTDLQDPAGNAWVSLGQDGNRFVVALCLFLAINLIVAGQLGSWTRAIDKAAICLDRKTPLKRTFTWWTTKAYLEQSQPPDVVLLGSSLMGSAVFASDAHELQLALDFVKHRRGVTMERELSHRLGCPVSVFNWSLGGAMASDAYMISRALFSDRFKPQLVIMGVSPRDFIDNSLVYAGATESFRFFSYFVDPGQLTAVALPDPMSRLEWVLDRNFPLRRLKIEIAHEAPNLSQEETGHHKQYQPLRGISITAGEVRPGQWLLPANIPCMFIDNTKEYINRYRNPNPPVYSAELKFFDEFLKLTKNSDIQVVVVGMPLLWTNRVLLPDSFWRSWREHMVAMCTKNNARWLDLSDSSKFDIDDFLDTVHMNASGGSKLFKILASAVVEQPRLAARLVAEKDKTRSLAGSSVFPH